MCGNTEIYAGAYHFLTKSAADVIDGTFGKNGIVARMGGDEFIAILTTSVKQRMKQGIQSGGVI